MHLGREMYENIVKKFLFLFSTKSNKNLTLRLSNLSEYEEIIKIGIIKNEKCAPSSF